MLLLLLLRIYGGVGMVCLLLLLLEAPYPGSTNSDLEFGFGARAYPELGEAPRYSIQRSKEVLFWLSRPCRFCSM
jgi:hypothetical protein